MLVITEVDGAVSAEETVRALLEEFGIRAGLKPDGTAFDPPTDSRDGIEGYGFGV